MDHFIGYFTRADEKCTSDPGAPQAVHRRTAVRAHMWAARGTVLCGRRGQLSQMCMHRTNEIRGACASGLALSGFSAMLRLGSSS